LASSISAADTAPADGAHRYLLFGVAGRTYGCEIDVVREIVPFRRCTRLPGAPEYVCGLINLRGTVVTVLDLGLRLGAAPVDRAEGSIVLVEQGSRVVGLGVDEMRDVQRLGAGEIDSSDGAGAEGAGNGSAGGAVRGIARAQAGVVVLLDVGSIIKQALL
jgi:purine-binding chemotaxis protein CheW